MSQRRGPRRDMQATQRILQQGRRSLLDPWEGGPVPGNQQSNLAAQTALLAQLVNPGAQAALTDSLINTLLGRPEINQLQSILALNASQRVGQQLGGELQPSFGGMNRNRLYDEGMRGPRPLLPKRLPDRKKAVGPPRNRMARPVTKAGDKSEKKEDSNEAKEEAGSGSRSVNHKEDTKKEDGKQRKRKLQDVDDSDDEDGGPFSGISSDHFYCHVCEKRMWDDKSFSNHIKGRAHLGLMELRDELYKIQVDLMRHEVQLAEALRNIEMDRIRRRGKNIRAITQEYCTMCDLHFFGNIVAHRKQDSHQALKKFLHPCCAPCGKEFHTRIEWDEHKLSPEHMKKCPEGGDDLKLDTTIELDDFELETKVMEEILADNAEDGASALNIRRLVPKYNPDAGFALKMVVPATGFECPMCKSFFIDEETVSIHCRTKTHFDNYVAYEKRKAKRVSRETKPIKKPRLDVETKVEPTESEGVENAETSLQMDDSFNKTMNTTTGDTLVLETDDDSMAMAMDAVNTAEESNTEGQKEEDKKE